MYLMDQIKRFAANRPTNIGELIRLALTTVHDDDVLLSVRWKEPLGCVNCGREEEATPHACQAKGHTDVVLVCPQCVGKVDFTRIQKLADLDELNTAFIWEVNHQITVLDNELHSEVIQWEG